MAINPSTNAAAQRFPLIKSLLGDLGLRRKPISPVDHQPPLPPSETDPENLAPGQMESTENQATTLVSTAEDEEKSLEQKALGLGIMLAPGVVCVTIFNSVLQVKPTAEGRRELPLFEPIVSFIVLGFYSSLIGLIYAMVKKKEACGLRQRAEVERVKIKWLMAAWLFTAIAFLLWILLDLPAESLLKVSLGVVAGSVLAAAVFWPL